MVRPVFGGKPDGGGCRRARANEAVLWVPEEMVADPANRKTPGSVRTALPPSPGGGGSVSTISYSPDAPSPNRRPREGAHIAPDHAVGCTLRIVGGLRATPPGPAPAQSATLRASPPNTCSTERGSPRPGAAPGESDGLCARASSAARTRGGPAHAPAIRFLSGREAWADGCRVCYTLGAAREHVHRRPSPTPLGNLCTSLMGRTQGFCTCSG